jgi:hypothetical protein
MASFLNFFFLLLYHFRLYLVISVQSWTNYAQKISRGNYRHTV